jgi:ligand-binding SRPBCC domain-containing protein
MMLRAQFEQWVPFPLERVFLFFANPQNLPRIMPPASDTKIEGLKLLQPSPPQDSFEEPATLLVAGPKSEIITSFRILPPLPFRARWVAQITEFEWNRWFMDIQATGPFKTWHHWHEFEPATREGIDGTVVRDRIEYDVGLGWLGVIAQRLFVGGQMTRTFSHRHRILEELLRQADGNESSHAAV